MSDTFECGICGATVKANALACPECGADERTGLRRDAGESAYDGLELPEDDTFDYNEFAEREFGSPRPTSGKDLVIKIVAVVLIAVIFGVFVLW